MTLISVSSTVKYNDDTEYNNSALSLTKVSTITVNSNYTGSWRIAFSLKSGSSSTYVSGRIYKNGIAYGTLQSTNDTDYVTFSQDFSDITINSGDTIELWIASFDIDVSVYSKLFRIEFDFVGYNLHYIVGATDVDIISYVADFTLERELEKLLDKLTLKISRSIDNLSGFIGFEPNVELLLRHSDIGIFRGRVKTSDKKYYYEVEAFSCAEILSRSIVQKIYENTTPEAIFTDLINSYSDLTPNVSVSGVTIERFVADEYVSSIVSKLSEALGWLVYSDSSKNIYFRPRGTITNSVVIRRQANNSNAIFDKWKEDHNELCNDIRVTGDNINYNTQENFTSDGNTREYTLNEQPINIKITIDSIEQLIGSYMIYTETKKIIFNTAPTSNSNISVDYTYAYPLYVVREDATSISTYGRFTKILFLKWFKNRADIIVYCTNYITTYKNPLLSNNIIMSASYITSFTPGEQIQIIDDLESYNTYYVINKIKLEYRKGLVELNIGSYIPIFVNIQGTIQDRIKELEKNLSKSSIQKYSTNSEILSPTETLTENDKNYINFKIDLSNRPKCNFGRGTDNDARVGLCES